jgi:hypothetical protein
MDVQHGMPVALSKATQQLNVLKNNNNRTEKVFSEKRKNLI